MKTGNSPDRWRVSNTVAPQPSRWLDVLNPTTLASASSTRIIVERIRSGQQNGGILFANVGDFNGTAQGMNIPNSGPDSYMDNRVNRADWNELVTRGASATVPGLLFSGIFGNPGQTHDGWHEIPWRLFNPISNSVITQPDNALIRLRTTNSPSNFTPNQFLFMEFAQGTITGENYTPPADTVNNVGALNIPTSQFRTAITDIRPDGGASDPQVWALQVNVPENPISQTLLESGTYQYIAPRPDAHVPNAMDNGRWHVFSNNPRIQDTV